MAGQLPENYSDLDRYSGFLTFVVNSEGEAERRRRGGGEETGDYLANKYRLHLSFRVFVFRLHVIMSDITNVTIITVGKNINVHFSVKMINLHSPISSFSTIPCLSSSRSLRIIIIILFDLIQGNGLPYLNNNDLASFLI